MACVHVILSRNALRTEIALQTRTKKSLLHQLRPQHIPETCKGSYLPLPGGPGATPSIMAATALSHKVIQLAVSDCLDPYQWGRCHKEHNPTSVRSSFILAQIQLIFFPLTTLHTLHFAPYIQDSQGP